MPFFCIIIMYKQTQIIIFKKHAQICSINLQLLASVCISFLEQIVWSLPVFLPWSFNVFELKQDRICLLSWRCSMPAVWSHWHDQQFYWLGSKEVHNQFCAFKRILNWTFSNGPFPSSTVTWCSSFRTDNLLLHVCRLRNVLELCTLKEKSTTGSPSPALLL